MTEKSYQQQLNEKNTELFEDIAKAFTKTQYAITAIADNIEIINTTLARLSHEVDELKRGKSDV